MSIFSERKTRKQLQKKDFLFSPSKTDILATRGVVTAQRTQKDIFIK